MAGAGREAAAGRAGAASAGAGSAGVREPAVSFVAVAGGAEIGPGGAAGGGGAARVPGAGGEAAAGRASAASAGAGPAVVREPTVSFVAVWVGSAADVAGAGGASGRPPAGARGNAVGGAPAAGCREDLPTSGTAGIGAPMRARLTGPEGVDGAGGSEPAGPAERAAGRGSTGVGSVDVADTPPGEADRSTCGAEPACGARGMDGGSSDATSVSATDGAFMGGPMTGAGGTPAPATRRLSGAFISALCPASRPDGGAAVGRSSFFRRRGGVPTAAIRRSGAFDPLGVTGALDGERFGVGLGADAGRTRRARAAGSFGAGSAGVAAGEATGGRSGPSSTVLWRTSPLAMPRGASSDTSWRRGRTMGGTGVRVTRPRTKPGVEETVVSRPTPTSKGARPVQSRRTGARVSVAAGSGAVDPRSSAFVRRAQGHRMLGHPRAASSSA